MNRLSDATSPYLLQHADNPVDWWPWCPEALASAKQRQQPVLLSIGYSACHWCHVMAHESFEDEAIAGQMNAHFVNIKVDREERPDLDKIYQLAYQALVRQAGGWPLTMFLDPDDQTPFFGGTYFPPARRHGMPSFADVLSHVEGVWREQRDAVKQQNHSMQTFLQATAAGDDGASETLGRPQLAAAVEALARQYDEEHGGFSQAPKFPHAPTLRWLLDYRPPQGDRKGGEMALQTLRHMALGGINDQLAGGFCRYSVDRYWMIPHFEKMAYDNAQLLPLYARAAQLDQDPIFRATALALGHWVIRDLQAPEGGYYSSWDADSEGHEGTYYLWTPEQVKACLSEADASLAITHWGLDRAPNFEHSAWHLHVFVPVEELSRTLGLEQAEIRQRLDSIRQTLLAQREQRVKPERDDKILTSWTGLMISGMADSGRWLGHPPLVASARRALDYVRGELWRGERLLATARNGQAQLNAYLDDYAAMLQGVLALLQSDWRDDDLEFAQALATALLAHFEDRESGGFFFTSHDHETLIQRPKPWQDEAMPAGNALAAEALLRLGHLLAEPAYLQAAARTLDAAAAAIAKQPHAYCALLRVVQDQQAPPIQLIVTAAEVPADLPQQLVAALDGRAACYILPPHSCLSQRYPCRGDFTAYLCHGLSCSAPIETPQALLAALADA